MSKNQKKNPSTPSNYLAFNWTFRDTLAENQKKREQEYVQPNTGLSIKELKAMVDEFQAIQSIPAAPMPVFTPSLPSYNWFYTKFISEPPSTQPCFKDKIKALEQVEPRKVSERMPDSVSPIVGWRGWRVNHGGKLMALGCEKVWKPKKEIKAVCAAGGGHPAPGFDCTCGIWAFKDVDRLTQAINPYPDTKIIGPVYLWGRVIETENGFRAEFAYPKELWLMDSSLEQVGYLYGVPIRSI